MGSVSFKKAFILSLCLTVVVHISQCNSYPANNVWPWMRETKDDNIIERFTVEQEDSHLKHSSFCQLGDVNQKCYPALCKTKSHKITFPTPFDEVPHVMVAINILDVDKNFNTRMKAVAEEVTTTGFTFKTVTWSDTRIYAVGASWTACSSRETLC